VVLIPGHVRCMTHWSGDRDQRAVFLCFACKLLLTLSACGSGLGAGGCCATYEGVSRNRGGRAWAATLDRVKPAGPLWRRGIVKLLAAIPGCPWALGLGLLNASKALSQAGASRPQATISL